MIKQLYDAVILFIIISRSLILHFTKHFLIIIIISSSSSSSRFPPEEAGGSPRTLLAYKDRMFVSNGVGGGGVGDYGGYAHQANGEATKISLR